MLFNLALAKLSIQSPTVMVSSFTEILKTQLDKIPCSLN